MPCRSRSTGRSPSSSWQRWEFWSINSLPNKSSTWPPGPKALRKPAAVPRSSNSKKVLPAEIVSAAVGDMQEWTALALDTAKTRGASFADARVVDLRLRDLSTKNGEVGTLAENESLGLGIRAPANGCWGFASSDVLTRQGAHACAAPAIAIARASAMAKRADA